MTGGRVVVLGRTGRNFAAGMSGGIAYVVDGFGFEKVCNREMVSLAPLEDPEEIAVVRRMIEKHVQHTRSALGARLLQAFPRFLRVIPNDYRRVLDAQERMRQRGLSPADAEMAAFEENAHDEMRAGGN
jgi:glutamate synthase (ferredoxin)